MYVPKWLFFRNGGGHGPRPMKFHVRGSADSRLAVLVVLVLIVAIQSIALVWGGRTYYRKVQAVDGLMQETRTIFRDINARDCRDIAKALRTAALAARDDKLLGMSSMDDAGEGMRIMGDVFVKQLDALLRGGMTDDDFGTENGD